jgi:tetratricopeptide (TPR) repeat protein
VSHLLGCRASIGMTLVRSTLLFLTLGLALIEPARAQHGHDDHDPRALAADPRLAPDQIAPLLEGLGDHHHEVTTTSERAQRFFDQGLALTYGFNHQEALRAFKEAARLDPDCAMAYWGWALVLGPNLNLPMRAEVAEQALEAIEMALARRDEVSPKERAYIDALARRHSRDPAADRATLDRDYADAMGELHAAYPDDLDAATLRAAALMNLSPWDYWTKDGLPKHDHIPVVLQVLESVIARDPQHEGALHYYIHAVEATDAARGERAADLLRGLAPNAGHLVHMPSHIYMQLGRYADAYEDNARAAAADESYITQCRAQGIYPLNYYPHNVHFLAWAATQQGRSADALAAARKVAAQVPHDMHGNDWALYETFLSMPLAVQVRFGMWEEILAEPAPPPDRRYFTGAWHFARGMAYAHTGRTGTAQKELRALRRLAAQAQTATTPVGLTNAGTLLSIAGEILSGDLRARTGDLERAIAHLDRAVRLEDSLTYNEPPDWFAPSRHYLGAALLEAGRPVEAEVVYWRDLAARRDNGYALAGLALALEAQGRTAEAAGIRERLARTWAAADVPLRTSVF